MSLSSSETPSDSLLSLSVPVSHPVLTLRAPGAQAVVGDVMELHCEVWRGSAPILYQFYHEDVALGSSSAPSGGGVSFNLSLTAEHSGNYYCEANNGLVAQRSEVVPLNIIGIAHAVELLRSMFVSQHSGRVLLIPQSFWWCATKDEASMGSPVLGDVSEGAWGTSKLVPLFSHQCDKLQIPRCINKSYLPTSPRKSRPCLNPHSRYLLSKPKPFSLAAHVQVSPFSAYGGQKRSSYFKSHGGAAWHLWSHHYGPIILLLAQEKNRFVFIEIGILLL